MILSEKPVSAFPDHALRRLRLTLAESVNIRATLWVENKAKLNGKG
jgi:hypothetical protein